MRRFIQTLFVLLFTSCSFNTYNYTSSSNMEDDIPALAYQSVARVYMNMPNRGQITATGFAIGPDLIMTAAHFCVPVLEMQILETKMTGTIEMEYYDDKLKLHHSGGLEVKEMAETEDICILEKKDHNLVPLSISTNYKNLQIRDRVWIVGAPQGVFLAEFPGRVITTSFVAESKKLNGKLVVSAASVGGVSGSPVLDKYGKVVGMLVMGSTSFDHLSICVPSPQLYDFAKKYTD